MKHICVFCGSSMGRQEQYRQAAIDLGTTMARQGVHLVWGGGRVGLMGTIADAVLAGGGQTVGVIPTFMVEREVEHVSSTELIEVDTMHARKAVMAERADGFIALPGGFGTLDELFEILTWGQLQIHGKPVGLLNVGGYFDPLLQWIDHAEREGFIRPHHRQLYTVANNAEALLEQMRQHAAPTEDWVGKVQLEQT
ncbi:MAG: TIGR00730 family Rossman fold protein [Burkholderiales bacterium]|nr:TIGR00730 family Rossman fold protein [Burkholderiales bacterium]